MHAIATQESRSRIADGALVIGWSLLIGLFSQISLPLPFTPIPIQTQSIPIFLGPLLFGMNRGILATLLFIVEGSLGLPVFAGGASGIALLFGPRGGYLIGYVLAAALIGKMVEKERSLKRMTQALFAGNGVLFFAGAFHLASFIGWAKALLLGVAPFIAGDLLKIGLILKLVKGKQNAS